ncbi:tRNA-dihydrouridine(20a/20b) synthase [Escovopsis weberi]|uniref:tRNA-dihydrouridine(20a/20b) synthase n=1 Tax=Escovopsis weberi TaxID=150374 RepID=A0A0M8N714_ESCWE|nr:tRNA-dihydrouridine(20a/20b) synthase [Escovopsis weberi]
MDYLDTVIGHPQNRLVDWITIHPRTRHTPSSVPIRTDALQILVDKYAGTLPILLSGDVFHLDSLPFSPHNRHQAPQALDLDTLSITERAPGDAPGSGSGRLSGVMSARGLLANPAMFAGYSACPWEAVERFMCNVARAPLPFKLVIHHVAEMCGPGMGSDKSSLLTKKERASLGDLANMMELVDYLDEKIAERTGQVGGLRRDF